MIKKWKRMEVKCRQMSKYKYLISNWVYHIQNFYNNNNKYQSLTISHMSNSILYTYFSLTYLYHDQWNMIVLFVYDFNIMNLV